MDKIENQKDYNAVMEKINCLMDKSGDVSPAEFTEIHRLAISAHEYEQKRHLIEAPSTLSAMIESKMHEYKLKQKDLAKKLNVSVKKLSLIMSGKQKADVEFLKALHSEFKVDAAFLLEHA
jgi:HTH-type transcriptional regulator/antitoxin HigA